MLKRLAIAGVSALVLAACADMPTDTAMQDVDLIMAAAPSAKVPVCHVGHKDDDAGLISLLLVNQKVADRHLNNPAHTYEGVSDYDPLAEGATGIGNEDTDGNGIDDGCEIPEVETIFAVAYTDVNPDDGGYNPVIDVLIAKVVDANGNQALDAGDEVITHKFPTAFDGSNHEEARQTTHTVDFLINLGPGYLILFTSGNENFTFTSDPNSNEIYTEESGTSQLIIKDHLATTEFDAIQIDAGTPSDVLNPTPTQAIIRFADNTFIDVEITLSN